MPAAYGPPASTTITTTGWCAVALPVMMLVARPTATVAVARADRWAMAIWPMTAAASVVVGFGAVWWLARLAGGPQRTGRRRRDRSRHDQLTGLPNRGGMLERLRHEIDRIDRTGPASTADGFGLMLVDPVGLQTIEDAYGRHARDDVLVSVARRLANAVRGADFVGRMAGDDFVLVCGVPADTASLTLLATRIRGALEAPMPVDFGVVTLSVHIDVIEIDPVVAASQDAMSTVLRRIDACRYRRRRADADDAV